MRPLAWCFVGWGMATPARWLEGLNVLEGKAYPHHPVMLQVPQQSFKIEPGFVMDLCGLKVPHYFDCTNLCNRSNFQWLGDEFNYYRDVPSRRLACLEHQAHSLAKLSHIQVRLPLIDDDYGEHVSVYQSVLRHRHGTFRVMELGARWGTWAARAITFLRAVKPEVLHEAYFVEPARRSCGAVMQVMKLNGIRYQLRCTLATPEVFLEMMQGIDFMDLLHVDIQGAEDKLFTDPRVAQVLRKHVARIILGTHSELIHSKLAELYKDWIPIFSLPTGPGHVACLLEHFRQNGTDFGPSVEDWNRVRERKCFHPTPQGGVVNMDGLLVLDNVRWVDEAKAFSLNDTDLRIDDLKA